MKNKAFILLIILFSFLASFFAVSLSIPNNLTPNENFGSFSKIYPDKWLVDEAEINIPNLYHRGNRVDFYFSSWHPEDRPVPSLEVYVCDKIASSFNAEKGSKQTIFLTGDCNPKSIKIRSINPFIASQKDNRRLVIQLDKVQVSSKLGLPIPSISSLVKPFLYFILISFFIYFSFLPVTGFGLASVFLVLSPNIYINYIYANPIALDWLAIVLASIFLGSLFARQIGKVEESEFSISKNIFYLFLFVIVLIAALLRFYNFDFGLPANYHPDEVPKFNAIMRMKQYDDLNPRYFLHPSLLLYGTYFFNNIFRFLTQATGEWSETLILSGRIMSVMAGTLSVFIVGLISKRLFNSFSGLLASLFLAVFPLHITCSRYVKEDALLTFFIVLAVYTVIRAVQEDRKILILFAGLFAGFSAGVKYSGIMSIFILVGIPFLKSKSFVPDWNYTKWTVRACFVMALGFLITTPYSILDMGTFLHNFMQEKNHMTRGHSSSVTAWSQAWMYHIKRSLNNGMQILPLILGLLGMGFLLRKWKMSGLYLVALILLYYLPAEYVKAKPAPQPERYIMPCLPFLAISAGYFASQIFKVIQNRIFKFAAVVLIILSIAQPINRSLELASELKPDTRDLMHTWMVKNLSKEDIILFDWKPYAPRFFNNELNVVYLNRATIIGDLGIENLKATNAKYLLLSSLFYNRYFNEPNAEIVHREHIAEVFRNFPIVKEVKSKYGTYGFHNPDLVLFKLKQD